MQGTHRDVCGEHLSVYLDQEVFGLDRRHPPMAALQTLLGLAGRHCPTTYRKLATHASKAA